MLEPPEFEPEFYEKQNAMMCTRYGKLFKRWHLSWEAYLDYASRKLRNDNYWLWVFLCGLEKFIQEQGDEEKGRRTRLYKDADERIRRIIGDSQKIKDYMRQL